MKVIVKDKNTLSDDTIGDVDIDLNALGLPEDFEDSEAICYEIRNKGVRAGKIFLKLSRRPIPEKREGEEEEEEDMLKDFKCEEE